MGVLLLLAPRDWEKRELVLRLVFTSASALVTQAGPLGSSYWTVTGSLVSPKAAHHLLLSFRMSFFLEAPRCLETLDVVYRET